MNVCVGVCLPLFLKHILHTYINIEVKKGVKKITKKFHLCLYPLKPEDRSAFHFSPHFSFFFCSNEKHQRKISREKSCKQNLKNNIHRKILQAVMACSKFPIGIIIVRNHLSFTPCSMCK